MWNSSNKRHIQTALIQGQCILTFHPKRGAYLRATVVQVKTACFAFRESNIFSLFQIALEKIVINFMDIASMPWKRTTILYM